MQVMGIINVASGSFAVFDKDCRSAAGHAAAMAESGVDIIDIGGESTRPGAPEVPAAEQIARVVPVIAELKRRFPALPLSVDTTRAEVAIAAAEAGAEMFNDVSMLRRDGEKLAAAAAKYGAKLILSHSRGTPENMMDCCDYGSAGVVQTVMEELAAAGRLAEKAGVAAEKIIYDPGIGFAKTPEQNWELLGKIAELKKLGTLLVGASRKSYLGGLDRLGGTIGTAVFLAGAGVDIIRVHDTAEVISALTAYKKLEESRDGSR